MSVEDITDDIQNYQWGCDWGVTSGQGKTFSGVVTDYNNFTEDMINLDDIAHSLARICRFNGHVNRHFSVAEHCLIGSLLMDCPEDRMEMLLHDAAEAYVGDVIRPFKEAYPQLTFVEDRIAGMIFDKFWPGNPVVEDGLYRKTAKVREWDLRMAAYESMAFRPHHLLPNEDDQGYRRWREERGMLMTSFFSHSVKEVYLEYLEKYQKELGVHDG